MNFHGDLIRHLIRNYLCEFIGNVGIYGYGDIWIYGDSMNPPISVEYPSNFRQLFDFLSIFVEVSSNFRQISVKCSSNI